MGTIILLTAGIVSWTALAMQWSAFYFKRSERDYVNAFEISQALEAKLQLLDDLKRQVDVLNLKAGFNR